MPGRPPCMSFSVCHAEHVVHVHRHQSFEVLPTQVHHHPRDDLEPEHAGAVSPSVNSNARRMADAASKFVRLKADARSFFHITRFLAPCLSTISR